MELNNMREKKFIAWDKINKKMVSVIDFSCLNYPEKYEVMQFTGLHDKNGKEIYEGYIVHVKNIKRNQLIGFDVGWACYGFVYNTGELMRKITPREMVRLEVIGNIYENPELMNE
jgi:uncharacterized phage protein (TIGR01671 family)